MYDPQEKHYMYVRLNSGSWIRFYGDEKFLIKCQKFTTVLGATSWQVAVNDKEMKRMYGDNFDPDKVTIMN